MGRPGYKIIVILSQKGSYFQQHFKHVPFESTSIIYYHYKIHSFIIKSSPAFSYAPACLTCYFLHSQEDSFPSSIVFELVRI